MRKVTLHSAVDVITNSSTVIYTYQDSVEQARELVQAILDMQEDSDITPDDVFYYGVFLDDYELSDIEDCPKVDWQMPPEVRKEQAKLQQSWIDNLKVSVITGEIEEPDWMKNAGDGYDYAPSRSLYLKAKDPKYKDLADKICKLLNSVSADGGYDG